MCIDQYHINLACLIKSPDSYEFMNVYMNILSVKVSIKIPSSVLWRWMKVMQVWNRWQIFHLWFLNTLKTTFQWINHIITTTLSAHYKATRTYTTCLRLHMSRPAWTGKKPQSPQRGTSWLWRASCPWWGWMMLCTTWGLCSFSLSSFSSVMNFLRTAWNLHTN